MVLVAAGGHSPLHLHESSVEVNDLHRQVGKHQTRERGRERKGKGKTRIRAKHQHYEHTDRHTHRDSDNILKTVYQNPKEENTLYKQ